MKILDIILSIFKCNDNDPCKDERCKGCAHIDGLICPYPNKCSAMIG